MTITIREGEYLIFSGREVHAKLENELLKKNKNLPVRILNFDYTMNGFMALCQINQILRHHRFSSVRLWYPYFPYARQDRWINSCESFSLKIFIDLLNIQNFDKVFIFDPHSDVTTALINNVVVLDQHMIALSVVPHDILNGPNIIFVGPDAGSVKKVSKFTDDDSRIGIGLKVRDLENKGRIKFTKFLFDGSLEDKDCLIVDDICDGGRTFVELGKEIRKRNPRKLYLYVTHGIFSQGFDKLQEIYDKIFTTNSVIKNSWQDFVKVAEIF